MQEMTVIMELKLLADVGLVGFPNAGKSTLLASVSAAKPKIANYPFTTLEPNLGIVSYRDSKSFVMADIPGIIEGASAGKGLGLRFLRHIERNSLLLFMVPADSDDIRKEYEILLNELSTFNPEMLDKQRVLAITKSDMLDQELMDEIEPTLPANVPHVFISSITGMGLSVLKDILWEELNKDSNKIEAIVHRPKDVSKLQQELKDMGEDEDLSYEYVEDDGSVSVGDYDMVPLIDRFVEKHPDFSYRGAKGILALTGYNGILGYRTDESYETRPADLDENKVQWLDAHPDFSLEKERAAAKKVADAMKAEGWEFASHTWGHQNVGCLLYTSPSPRD